MAALGFLKSKKSAAQPATTVKKPVMVQSFPKFNLVKPVLSEKASRLKEESNAYVFQIIPSANKTAAAKEIESLYKVHVVKVQTIKTPPKPKRTGRFSGYRSGYRKVIVKLRAGEKIDLV
jgi:large subunit ribosomal protein L23